MMLVIGKNNCPACENTKTLLKRKNIPYEYISITSGDSVKDEFWTNFLIDTLKVRSVPQVFQLIGHYNSVQSMVITHEFGD